METPKWVLSLKPGDTLIAIDPCTMNSGEGNALIVGKPYTILTVEEDGITLQSEVGKYHYFDHKEIVVFFKINQSFLREIQDTKPTFEEVRNQIKRLNDRGITSTLVAPTDAELNFLIAEGFTCEKGMIEGNWVISWNKQF